MGITAYLILSLVLLAALLGTGTYVHHRGFVAGQNERIAFYTPLIQAANEAKDRANARADKFEQTARAISEQSERDHELYTRTLQDRTNTADARIAQLLRERAAARAAACGGQVPPVAGPSTVTTGAGASDERDARLAGSVSRVGGQCEHDADELAEFQQWYARQKAAVDAMTHDAP